MLDSIHTHVDWLVAVTKAFREGDHDDLFLLRSKAEGWVQPEAETEAQTDLIDALLEALERLPEAY